MSHWKRLTAREVKAATTPGKLYDGGGLILVVDRNGRKRWAFKYTVKGRTRETGFGSADFVSLTDAREKAMAWRRDIALGIDPLADKAEAEAPPPLRADTFGEVAARYIAAHQPTWKSKKHGGQWTATLKTHAAALWSAPVATITTDDVLAVLRPLWTSKAETASRLRGRIEKILDAAKVEGLREGENPARWSGHLALALPKPKRLTRGHHAAMAYGRLPAFCAALQERPAVAARALLFTILTAARSGEVRAATAAEIDTAKGLWTIPGTRMKSGRPHRVPLSRQALALLAACPSDGFLFPPPRGGAQPFSDMAFGALLQRMGHDVTTHGFRSSFRDWAGDETDHAREVIEAALAHVVGDEAERAYRRGDALEKRRRLMQDWADYCWSDG